MKRKKQNPPKNTPHPATQTATNPRKQDVLALACILGLGLLVYGRAVTFDYLLYDEPLIIFDNPNVMAGLSLEGIYWAFMNPNTGLYMPLPTVMFMLDRSLFGDWVGGFHLMTVAWHLVCSCLFYIVVKRFTNNFPVAVAAGLFFCIHPIQSMTACIIVCRNDISMTVFMLASLEMYRRYTQRAFIFPAGCVGNSGWVYTPHPHNPVATNNKTQQKQNKAATSSEATFQRAAPALLSLLFMTIGLFCKQGIVMLPVGMLLLDYWPLDRIELSVKKPIKTLIRAGALILEKAPWFALSGLGIFFAFFGKSEFVHDGGEDITFSLYNVGVAIIDYTRYIGHMVYPIRYTGGYPFTVPTAPALLASLLLLSAITGGAIAMMWKRPWFIVGWGWFFFFLLPVSGIVRYAWESIALRYLYVPGIGLYLIGAYCLYEWAFRSRSHTEPDTPPENTRRYWATLTVISLILAVLCFWQGGFVRDTEAIALRGLAITDNRSALAHTFLGIIRADEGQHEEAYNHFQSAFNLEPENPRWRFNYAIAAHRSGRYEETLSLLEPLLAEQPTLDMQRLYARALIGLGRINEGIESLVRILRVAPAYEPAARNLVHALTLHGNPAEAMTYIEKMVDDTEVLDLIHHLLDLANAARQNNRQPTP